MTVIQLLVNLVVVVADVSEDHPCENYGGIKLGAKTSLNTSFHQVLYWLKTTSECYIFCSAQVYVML